MKKDQNANHKETFPWKERIEGIFRWIGKSMIYLGIGMPFAGAILVGLVKDLPSDYGGTILSLSDIFAVTSANEKLISDEIVIIGMCLVLGLFFIELGTWIWLDASPTRKLHISKPVWYVGGELIILGTITFLLFNVPAGNYWMVMSLFFLFDSAIALTVPVIWFLLTQVYRWFLRDDGKNQTEKFKFAWTVIAAIVAWSLAIH